MAGEREKQKKHSHTRAHIQVSMYNFTTTLEKCAPFLLGEHEQISECIAMCTGYKIQSFHYLVNLLEISWIISDMNGQKTIISEQLKLRTEYEERYCQKW